jgi:hypothetical protein
MKPAPRLIVVLLIILSLPFNSYSQAPFADESPVKTDLREAVFRYMFDHYNYGRYVKVYCIAAERPVPDAFIQRCSQIKPHVVGAFDCDRSAPMSSVRNKKTGETGMLLTIIDIQSIRGDEAKVKVEAFSDGIAANWNTLRIIFKEGHWKVVKDKVDGVS